MNHDEIKKINTHLLMKLCSDMITTENISKYKAKQCTLVINDAITQIREIKDAGAI